MNATVNVLCYKSKTLSNGEHPLMIRVCKDGKKKYVSLGVSVKPQYWDFEKNRPKRNCPNKEQINTLIKEQEQKYSEQILDFSSRNKSYTLTTLVETVDSSVKAKTVNGLFIEYLKSATKLFSVLLASKRPLITELADKLRLKYPLLPTISPCPTMRLEAIRSIIPISCRRYPKSV